MKGRIGEDLLALARGVAAVFVSLLPRRHWNAFDALPIERATVVSGILTVVGGLAVGARGFLAYAWRVALAADDMTLELATRQIRGEVPADLSITTLLPQSLSAMSIVAFLLFTPLGLLADYLVVSGFARSVSTLTDQHFGDPLLTAVDALVLRGWRRRKAARAQHARERREGTDVPDQLVTGEWAGLPDADFVVLAARRKPEWTAGAFILTVDRWYRLGEPFDIELPQGLRTGYPLTELKTTEVVRRGVRYDLPPLRQVRPRKAVDRTERVTTSRS